MINVQKDGDVVTEYTGEFFAGQLFDSTEKGFMDLDF